MVERDYRIEHRPDGWWLVCLRGDDVVSQEHCFSHDEALAIGCVWICGDDEDE